VYPFRTVIAGVAVGELPASQGDGANWAAPVRAASNNPWRKSRATIAP